MPKEPTVAEVVFRRLVPRLLARRADELEQHLGDSLRLTETSDGSVVLEHGLLLAHLFFVNLVRGSCRELQFADLLLVLGSRCITSLLHLPHLGVMCSIAVRSGSGCFADRPSGVDDRDDGRHRRHRRERSANERNDGCG